MSNKAIRQRDTGVSGNPVYNQPAGGMPSYPAQTTGMPPLSSTQLGQSLYPTSTPLMQALDWMLASPSIPLILRKQYFMLWENVVFGNYDIRDIKFLMSKFREWTILLCWYIPEQKWGNILVYEDLDETATTLELDLNLLLNMLQQLYYIQLTRGKEGFTVREMNTMRTFSRGEIITDRQSSQQGLRLF